MEVSPQKSKQILHSWYIYLENSISHQEHKVSRHSVHATTHTDHRGIEYKKGGYPENVRQNTQYTITYAHKRVGYVPTPSSVIVRRNALGRHGDAVADGT